MTAIHESLVDDEYISDLTPLEQLHIRLRSRGLDIAAAINPQDVDPILKARHEENVRMIEWVEAELEKERKEE